MKTCDRCGKKNARELGLKNYMGHGEYSDRKYCACEDCAHVIGCAMENYFYEFSLDWRKQPSRPTKTRFENGVEYYIGDPGVQVESCTRSNVDAPMPEG